MSKYSGKCDLADIYYIRDNWDFTKNKIYIKNNIIPLRIDCEKDLMPYFPYLQSYGSGDKDGLIIHLTDKSFVDIEEEERLNWCLGRAIRYFKKCKRKKIPFTKEECLKNCFWKPSEYEIEIVDRVYRLGEKATIRGLHTKFHDYYREQLYQDMIKAGWEETKAYSWCYGWERLFERMKENENKES